MNERCAPRVCYDCMVRVLQRVLVVALCALSATTASADSELYQTVPTAKSRHDLSQFLVAKAEKALKVRDWSRAIPLYQALVVARGPASPEEKQLATVWTLAGQNEEASKAWAAYADAITNEKDRSEAIAESQRLHGTPDPFADKIDIAVMASEAKQAFMLGRSAFAKKHYGDALVYFHMGYALAPDLPGFLRELGSTYDKLGEGERKKEFYRRYLVQRPFGANADVVRAELSKDKGALGTLIVTSSLPCTELWINRQKIPGKLPAAGLAVAPGDYKGLCFNPKYEMAMFEYATVEAGKSAALTFRWAVIVNKLERPYGRIAIEKAEAPGIMMDLGITSPEVGVPVPADGHKLKMVLKDDSGIRSDERMVQLEPGQRLVVQW
jgi:tetratricopeptide (TPR) repeat protein